jgi:tRNA threonylcarbamoyladenosine biosynthesis protein TsaB
LAATGFARGDAVPADQALPVYLRDKVAQTTSEREAAKALRDAAAGAGA